MEQENRQDEINELVQKLIDRAVDNKHVEYEDIKSLTAYFVARTLLKATKRVHKNFKKSAKNLFKAYKRSLIIEPYEDNLDLILMYKCMRHCADYYEIECENILKAMEASFDYAFSGHLIDFLLS